MISGNKNIEYKILNSLDDRDLVNYCNTNQEASKICSDETFWMNRTISKYSYIPVEFLLKNKSDRKWSDYYINDLRKINLDNNIKKAIIKGREDHVLIRFHHIEFFMKNYQNDDFIRKYVDNFLEKQGSYLNAAVIRNNINIVKILLNKGIDPNKTDILGTTALKISSEKGNIDITKVLLQNKSDPNIKDIEGKTALMYACENGYDKIVKLLIDYGADVNMKDNSGKTVINFAVYPSWKYKKYTNKKLKTSYENIRKMLLEHGAVE